MSRFVFLCSIALSWWLSACQSPSAGKQEHAAADSLNARVDSVPQTPEVMLNALNLQIEQKPQDYALYQQRSELYFQIDSLEQAVADIEEAIRRYPTGPDLRYWRGFLAYVQDDTAQAMRSLRTADSLGTKNPEVPYQMGQIYFLQGKYGLAMAAYKRAARLDAYDPQYIFAQGLLEETKGRYGEAAKLYKQSLGIDSSFAKSLTRLHDLYLDHYGSQDEAMKYNDILMRYSPGHPLGRYQRGIYHLNRALALNDGRSDAQFRKQLNEAVLSFTIAVNNDSSFAKAYYHRGLSYFFGEGRMNEALADFEQAAALDSSYAKPHFMLGSIYERNGDLTTALRYYQRAAELMPESRAFRKAVQEVREKLGS
jgi:tetratricopeptide (TPR) repeat protein